MYFIFILLSVIFNKCFCQIYYGYLNYTEYHVGNLNILISIPHDGYKKPNNIPDRTSSDAGIIDYNTWKLGTLVNDELIRLFKLENKKPFLVINNLHRIKLDPNRNNIDCCSGTGNDGYKAYLEYHSFIKRYENEFMEMNTKGYKQGLLIDLHGQSHAENWVEVGYLLTENQLAETVLLNPSYSSIRLLDAVSSYTFDDLIRGTVSFGGVLQTKFGIKSVPSPNNKSPGAADYFTGGYITRTYGSIDCKKSRVNAIQVEVPYYMRDNKDITQYSKKLAQAIYDYYILHNMDALLTPGLEEIEINEMVNKCKQNN